MGNLLQNSHAVAAAILPERQMTNEEHFGQLVRTASTRSSVCYWLSAMTKRLQLVLERQDRQPPRKDVHYNNGHVPGMMSTKTAESAYWATKVRNVCRELKNIRDETTLAARSLAQLDSLDLSTQPHLLNITSFLGILKKIGISNELLVERLFYALDTPRRGNVCKREVMIIIASLMRDVLSAKLSFGFRTYTAAQLNVLPADEVRNLVHLILACESTVTGKELNNDVVTDCVADIMRRLRTVQDNAVSFDQFHNSVTEDVQLMTTLEQCLTSRQEA